MDILIFINKLIVLNGLKKKKTMDTGSFPDEKKCGPSSSDHTKGIHNNDIGIQFVHQSNGLDRHEFFVSYLISDNI